MASVRSTVAYSPTFALAEKNTSRNGILQLPPEKENRIAVSSIVSAGNVRAFMLKGRNPRPSPQCPRYLPLRGRTDRRWQQTLWQASDPTSIAASSVRQQ